MHLTKFQCRISETISRIEYLISGYQENTFTFLLLSKALWALWKRNTEIWKLFKTVPNPFLTDYFYHQKQYFGENYCGPETNNKTPPSGIYKKMSEINFILLKTVKGADDPSCSDCRRGAPQSAYINRVPQCMSLRRNWDSPNPSLASECAPSPGTRRGTYRLRVSPDSDDWRKSLALCLLCEVHYWAGWIFWP